jgi:hypothetical protein
MEGSATRAACSDPATHWRMLHQVSPGTGQQGRAPALQGVKNEKK